MTIKTSTIQVKTTGRTDIVDISPQVETLVAETPRDHSGLVVLFISGSTAALTTIEYERGAVDDLVAAIQRLAPEDIPYRHDARWGDGNGYAHVRAALMGPSLTIPLVKGKMLLGTWQQIVLCDFDNRPRTRQITVQVHSS